MSESDWLYLVVDAAKRQIVSKGPSMAMTSSYEEALELLRELSVQRKEKLMLTCYVKLQDIPFPA